uniref:PGG domain-containing protein n=1 Tax=Leersia perrieri TaxID=77586 RepID=A0A0D9XCK9_9ORYZ
MHRKHLVAAACRCGRQKEGGQLIPLPPAMIENQAAESSTEVSGESFSSAGSVLQLDGITPIEQNHSALHMIATHQLCFECTKSMHDNIKSQPTDSRFGGDTTCHYAARAGNLTTLCHLITLEGRYGYGEMKKVLEKQNERGETILHEAVRRADRNMVEYLMYYQTDLASILSDGTSPLYLAVSLGYHDIAEMIYNGSQQLSYSGPNGQNALHASVLRSEEMTNKLLKWQKELAEQKDQHGSTPLHLAVSVEDRSSIKICWFPFYRPLEVPIHELLEASKSPAFEPDQSGSFPIHIAASMGVQKAISVLLKKCPDCAGLRDAKGKTFLHVAVERKRLNVVKFACRNTDLSWILNMQDSDGNTALHLVIQAGDLGIFGCLMGNQQVCLNLANNSGLTPLDLAESKIPPQFSIQWTALNLIHETIKCAKAKHGNIRRDLLKKKHSCQRDVENESERLTKLAQIVIIGSVLIATVTFAAAFTLPGGFRQDDHANGGTPILAGSYTLHAFIIANTIAFVYSSLATFSLIYSAMPFVDLSIRRAYFRSSVGVVACSLRTLAVSFVLAVYTVIAPVDHITALVVCLSASVVISFGHLNIVQTLGLAWALHGRMGFRLSGMLLLRVMMQLALAYWSYPLIFGLPAYLRSHRIGQHQP